MSGAYERMKRMTGKKEGGGKHFIKGAIRHKGALTAAAHRRGESVSEIEAHPPANAGTRLKREINFAKELRGFNHG